MSLKNKVNLPVCTKMHLLIMLQVQKYWFPENEMKKRYPQIQGFFAISSFTGDVSILQFHVCASAFYSEQSHFASPFSALILLVWQQH